MIWLESVMVFKRLISPTAEPSSSFDASDDVKEHAMTKQKREMQETVFHLGYTHQISNRGQNKPPWNVIT